MSYKQRLTAPIATIKYYTKNTNGGYNPCILGNAKNIAAKWKGCVMPNCVGYAAGRFNEIIGENNCRYLGNTNAKNFAKLAASQGLTVVSEPTLGGCLVWDKADGAGHVAIVEDIIDDDTILVSESGWSAKTIFWTATHKRGNGNWIEGTDTWMAKGYTYIGCVVNPAVSDTTVPALKRGSRNIWVSQLQKNLNEILKSNLIVDGSFGAATAVAVKSFQARAGLTQDGIVGDATQLAITAALADLALPDGVEPLMVITGGQRKSAWATKIDDDTYIRITDLQELELIKSFAWDDKLKAHVVRA